MTKLEDFLYHTTKEIMSTWEEQDIYAVSFFVYSNEMFHFGGYDNVSTFAISYNTEADCGNAGPHTEKRWNYAFWRQDEWRIIEPDENSMGMQLLFEWYREQGITNVGYEGVDTPDGPVGFPELVDLTGKVARRLQEEGFLLEKFGRPIPILIHDLEYTDCTLKATEYANPNGEAADFLYGNWETEPVKFPSVSEVKTFAAELLNDPRKLEKFFGSSPGIPQEYLLAHLKKLSEK